MGRSWQLFEKQIKQNAQNVYHKIQETAREDLPYLPIAYPKAVIAVDKKV